MLKRIQQLGIALVKPLILSIALFFSLLIVPNLAYAAQNGAVSLDSNDPELLNVVTVFTTTPETQEQVLSSLSNAEATKFARIPGFLDASILKAQDGSRAIALSRWKGKDLSNFQSYAEGIVKYVRAVPAAPPQAFSCQVKHTETRATAPSFQKDDVITFSQYKLKPSQDQSELATVISQEMAGVRKMIPGLQWAAMCPSTDKSTIAVLARWDSRDDFESLGDLSDFDKETNYWQAYADREHDVSEVVQIVR